MTKDEALKLALEALEKKACSWGVGQESLNNAAIAAIKKALAPPEERNFCPRCGKLAKDIHTCTPPQPINWADHEPT